MDGVRLDAREQEGLLAAATMRALNPHPIALLQPQALGVVGVHLHAGAGPQLAAPGQLAMLAVEVHRDAATAGGDEGVHADGCAYEGDTGSQCRTKRRGQQWYAFGRCNAPVEDGRRCAKGIFVEYDFHI